jgi:Domain of unknown function (DUF4282)
MDYHYLSSSGKPVFRRFRESNLAPQGQGGGPPDSGRRATMSSFPWEKLMPDRSSHQGLPDEWNHGSHAARESFSATGASDGYDAAATGAHRARTADGYGTGPTDTYGAAQADAFGARTDSFAGRADSFGAGTADAFGARPAGTYGTGAADPFGDGDPFGPRASDPFGPPTTTPFSAVKADAGTARPEAERPMAAIGGLAAGAAADARGFLGALFDFGFTSFVTPKIIRVLYMLIMAGTVISALVFTIIVFKASMMFGFLMLVIGDPLFILIVLAIYRVTLEFFAVTFRVAEDIRALRERGNPT